jgi:A/G-specific adenine glycosylase
MVVDSFDGRVPDTPETIATLPGIGRYTAGAILSIAYEVKIPLVDANVARVLSRVFEVRGDIKSTAAQARLWDLAERLVPEESPGDFNQGLMELGALICIPSDPRCEQCPLLPFCFAGNSPDPSALPEIAPGRATVTVTHSSAVIRDDSDHVLIIQRPPHGLWGGLWEFPRAVCNAGENPEEAACRAAYETVGAEIVTGKRLTTVRHTVTHHRITLHAYEARLAPNSPLPQPLGCASYRWVSPRDLLEFAFSAPQTLVVEAVQRRSTQGGSEVQPTLDLTTD